MTLTVSRGEVKEEESRRAGEQPQSPPVRHSNEEGPSGEQPAEPVSERPGADAEGDASQRGGEEGTRV